MKVVSLKRDEPEIYQEVACDYPWSMRITLHADVLKQLGIEKLPGVHDVVQLEGAAVVVSVTDDGMERRVELQITDLGVSKPRRSGADALYGTD